MTDHESLQPSRPRPLPIPALERPGSLVAIVSGKGGVGKTNIAVNVAIAAARLKARVLLVDGDLGLANVDALLGLVPRCTAAEILTGQAPFEEAIVTGPGGVHILPAASARMDLAAARPTELTRLLAPLVRAGLAYDLVLVDIGAGIGPAAMSLAAVCNQALLVTTPEPTSLTDAYATFKVLRKLAPRVPVELFVNIARDQAQAREVHAHLERVTRHFLDQPIALRGFLPRDLRLVEAVASQRAVVEAYPTSPSAQKLIELARLLLRDAAKRSPASGDPASRDGWRRIGS